MASAGEDAIVREAEVAGIGCTKKNRRRMISDYLGDSDGEPFPSDTPPQLRLPRFTCATFRFARLGRKRGGSGRKEVVGVGANRKTEAASLDSSAAGSKLAETSTSSSSSASAEAGGSGVGASVLLLLLARTCVELNRMAEVRAQMEALLKEIRDEAGSRMKKVAVTPPTTGTFNLQTSPSSSCTSDSDANHHRHHQATTSSSAAEETVPRKEFDAAAAEFEADDGVVALELEAAAEFETEPAPARHRLTIECSTELENSDESSDDEFIELDGGRFDSSDRNCWEWDDAGDEDSEEGSTAGAQDDGGVCAVDLERRLHEVLHRRHRERIEELESALRRAEQKLREKEMEARLWRDTATLALQPPPRDGH